MKKWVTILIIIVVIGAGIFLLHKFHKKPEAAATVAVQRGDITEKSQAVGYIKPQHSITIKSEIDGTVDEIYCNEGEHVTRGQPLIKIKPAPSPVEYATVHQQLDQAKAEEKSAKKDFDRYSYALKTGLITSTYGDYIYARRAYLTAKTQRILAEQKLALLDKGATTVAGKPIANIVKSPIDGYILNRIVDVGDPVLSLSSAQVSTTLFTVANMAADDLMFEGVVDEMDAAKIHLKMPAKIIIGSLSDVAITGELTEISLQSEKENIKQGAVSDTTDSPFNVGFKVKIAKLKLPKGVVLRSGYSATADIKISTAQDVLLLPIRVIHFDGDDGNSYVLLPPEGKKGKAQPKKQQIETGLSDGVNIEIKTGLEQGQQVLDVASKEDANED
jgi:HlyD family secretion protein